MSRIRSIKPDFWTSAQVLECSPNARLLFIGLWNFCDDAGRHPYSAKQAKAEVFPGDSFTEEQMEGMLQELSKNGLIMPYAADGKEFFVVTGWKHQRIDKPQPAKYPEPSTNILGTLPPDRKGKDRKGEDKKDGADAPDLKKELFDRGRAVLGNKASGLIAKVLRAQGNEDDPKAIAKARALIEQASTKANPAEWLGRTLAPKGGEFKLMSGMEGII